MDIFLPIIKERWTKICPLIQKIIIISKGYKMKHRKGEVFIIYLGGMGLRLE